MTRQMDVLGEKILQNAESCRLVAYPDPGTGGIPWTCGWGATGPDIHRGTVWTQAQADARLQADLQHFENAVTQADGTAPTSDNQFSAMCDLAYNIGIGNFLSSSVLRFHKVGDYQSAAAAFALWNRGGGQVLNGLVKRRAAEAALYLTPDGSNPANGSDGDDGA